MSQIGSGASPGMVIICVCFQELKAVLPVASLLQVSTLVLSGYNIPALVVILPVLLVVRF